MEPAKNDYLIENMYVVTSKLTECLTPDTCSKAERDLFKSLLNKSFDEEFTVNHHINIDINKLMRNLQRLKYRQLMDKYRLRRRMADGLFNFHGVPEDLPDDTSFYKTTEFDDEPSLPDMSEKWKKEILHFVENDCEPALVRILYDTFSKIANQYPDEFRDLALEINDYYRKTYVHKAGMTVSKLLDENKYLSTKSMEGNKTYIIGGDYIVNNGQINNGPVQYNINQSPSHTDGTESKGTEIKRADKLADMIKEEYIDLYKKNFNELLAPHLVGDVKDPMEVVDMKFSHNFKKRSIYSAFSVLSNYLKDEFSVRDLACYMQSHIDGMPKEVDSILKGIRTN